MGFYMPDALLVTKPTVSTDPNHGQSSTVNLIHDPLQPSEGRDATPFLPALHRQYVTVHITELPRRTWHIQRPSPT